MLARGPGPAWRVASGRLAPPLLASSPRRANSSWGAGCNAAPGWKKARTPSPPPCKRRDPDEPKPWLSTPALKANYRIPTSRLLVVRNLVLDGLDHAPDELRYQLARAMPAWTGADAAGVVHDAFSRVDVPLMPGGKPCGFAYLEVGADSDFHGLRVALDGATLGDRVVTCKAATPMMRVENALTVDHVLALVAEVETDCSGPDRGGRFRHLSNLLKKLAVVSPASEVLADYDGELRKSFRPLLSLLTAELELKAWEAPALMHTAASLATLGVSYSFAPEVWRALVELTVCTLNDEAHCDTPKADNVILVGLARAYAASALAAPLRDRFAPSRGCSAADAARVLDAVARTYALQWQKWPRTKRKVFSKEQLKKQRAVPSPQKDLVDLATTLAASYADRRRGDAANAPTDADAEALCGALAAHARSTLRDFSIVRPETRRPKKSDSGSLLSLAELLSLVRAVTALAPLAPRSGDALDGFFSDASAHFARGLEAGEAVCVTLVDIAQAFTEKRLSRHAQQVFDALDGAAGKAVGKFEPRDLGLLVRHFLDAKADAAPRFVATVIREALRGGDALSALSHLAQELQSDAVPDAVKRAAHEEQLYKHLGHLTLGYKHLGHLLASQKPLRPDYASGLVVAFHAAGVEPPRQIVAAHAARAFPKERPLDSSWTQSPRKVTHNVR